jgi:RNA polymerase subunit RPABC4/transcription elongation factor Spt4
MLEEKKTKFCFNCGTKLDIKAKICSICGVEQPVIPGKVSNWWYLVPIFFKYCWWSGGLAGK